MTSTAHKISAVEALILFSEQRYTQQQGLEVTPAAHHGGENKTAQHAGENKTAHHGGEDNTPAPHPKTIFSDRYAGGRHLAVYPPGEQTVIVRLETDAGFVGWGEAHAPYGPSVTQSLILT